MSTQAEPHAVCPLWHEAEDDPFEQPVTETPAMSATPARAMAGARDRPDRRARRRQQSSSASAASEASPPVPVEAQLPPLEPPDCTGLVSEMATPPFTHWPPLQDPTAHVTCLHASSTQVPA
jgi:hypothetical protein